MSVQSFELKMEVTAYFPITLSVGILNCEYSVCVKLSVSH